MGQSGSCFPHLTEYMPKSYRIAAITLAMFLAFADGQSTRSAQEIAKTVDRKYNGLKTLKMDFIETYSGAGRIRTESGTLLLKQPGRMRWDYREPRQKIFLADGKNAFFYVPGDRQARKASLKKLDDLRSPLRYLLGKAKLEKEFPDLALVDGAKVARSGNVVVGGVPRRMADRVQQVLFEVNPQDQIERIVIEEIDGTTTEFRFTQIEEGVAIADTMFKFERPANVELVNAPELSD
jgi:outer membrane lipoprotein carrier protein